MFLTAENAENAEITEKEMFPVGHETLPLDLESSGQTADYKSAASVFVKYWFPLTLDAVCELSGKQAVKG